MKNVTDLIQGLPQIDVRGDMDCEVSGIAFDSRKIREGFMFVAVRGTLVDGHNYIPSAIDSGAKVIVCERGYRHTHHKVTWIETENTTETLGMIAANYYSNPSQKLKVVGITGTNGKTTCATLLYQLFRLLGYSTGLISTISNKINNQSLPTSFTTPDAISLNILFKEMVDRGCTHCFMEVSSHALAQNRVYGVNFSGAVFTNITHDHLDYHKTFDAYIEAKKRIFDYLPSSAFALVNSDDKRCGVMLQNTEAQSYTYALKTHADFRTRVVHSTLSGLELSFDGLDVWFGLMGIFNAYNLLAVYASAMIMGEEKEAVLSELSKVMPVNGRFEAISNSAGIIAIVDYAHTPDALKNVLKTLDSLRTKQETLVTVLGCGGDRDKEKRPLMAKTAIEYSDKVILTSDNPRFEDPYDIIQEMKGGIPVSRMKNVMSIENRTEALRTACNLVDKGDILLVAGKGHETYQEISGKKYDFDDKRILEELLN